MKVSHYAAREITALAIEYLAVHRDELIPEAIASARAMILRGDLGKRAQRALVSGVPAGRQCDHPQEGRHRLGAGYIEAHH